MWNGEMGKVRGKGREIREGDTVIVYEKRGVVKAVKVEEGGVVQNRFGVFMQSEWIGKPFGSRVVSSRSSCGKRGGGGGGGGGGYVYLLAPTPQLWTLALTQRTQILYVADISFLIMYLEVVPGSLLLESGTGTGSLTVSLARAVAPFGHVYSFDFHPLRAASAREDFEGLGLTGLVTVGVRDIQGMGFPEEFRERADSVFLDLPQPWLAIPSAGKMLKQDGVLCCFSPCIEQVQQSSAALASNFTEIRTYEVLLRTYQVQEWRTEGGDGWRRKRRQRAGAEDGDEEGEEAMVVAAKPTDEARGHTGYLTFARLKCFDNLSV